MSRAKKLIEKAMGGERHRVREMTDSLPQRLRGLPQILDIFHRIKRHFMNGGEYLVVVPIDLKFSLGQHDLLTLLQRVGLQRMQVNDLGEMTFYFELDAEMID